MISLIKINKEKDYILNEINSKYNELTEKNKYINDNLKLKIRQQFKQLLIYNEYEKKIEYKFIKDPKNLKYNKDIAHENTKFGYNDIFEIYISIKDSKEYLVSANYTNYNIEIYALDNSIIYPLKGHQNDIRTVRYFLDKRDLDDNFNEYLISADDSKIVIVWDIINNYNIKCKIDTKYGNCIFSCLLVFPFNINDSYIITSTNDSSKNNDKSATKIYSLDDGKFIKHINHTNTIKVYFLLLWFNKIKDKYYIVQLANKKILISNLLEDETYCDLKNEPESDHKVGFIHTINNNDYLFSSSDNGYINIWDLFNKNIFKTININNGSLSYLIQWNNKNIIIADNKNKSLKIINMDNYEVICDIEGKQTNSIICIKKINHPIYGETLLTAGNDNIIKLWN